MSTRFQTPFHSCLIVYLMFEFYRISKQHPVIFIGNLPAHQATGITAMVLFGKTSNCPFKGSFLPWINCLGHVTTAVVLRCRAKRKPRQDAVTTPSQSRCRSNFVSSQDTNKPATGTNSLNTFCLPTQAERPRGEKGPICSSTFMRLGHLCAPTVLSKLVHS